MAEIVAEFLDGQQANSCPPNVDWSDKKGHGELDQFVVNENLMDQAIQQTNNNNTDDPYGICAADLKGVYGAIKQQLISVTKQSFDEANVPASIKKVHIIMLPKPPKKPDKPQNLRPINLASVILKLMERVAILQLLPHLGEGSNEKREICAGLIDSYFSKQQGGFRKGHGTAQGLLRITQVIQKFLSTGSGGIVLALDFAKAFDTVPHDKLLESIKDAKIMGRAGEWVQSWAQYGQYEVKIGDKFSKPREIRSGVRQGSCLGPLCFIIFINSLIESLLEVSKKINQSSTFKSLDGRCYLQVYADDITLMIQFPQTGRTEDRISITQKIIQDYLDVCSEWSKKWGLWFNPSKCEFVTIGTKRANVDLNIYLYDDKPIKKADRIKILGLIIEGHKANPFGKMISEARRKMQFSHSRLKTLFNLPNYKLMNNLYWSIIVANSLYASPSWNTEIFPCDIKGNRLDVVTKENGETVPVSYTHLTLPTIYSV